MIKVMHVLLSLEYGGAEKVAVNLINGLQGDGFIFSVCALDRIGPISKELNNGIQVECVSRKAGIDLLLPFKLAKVMKRLSPDIVHMHNSTPLLYGTIAARLTGIDNIIVTQHGSITKESKKARFVINRVSKWVARTVPVSEDIEEHLKKTYKISSKNLKTIKNGIDLDLFRKDSTKRQEIRSKLDIRDEFVIGHVARLSPEKNQETLIRAFAQVAKEMPNVKLMIIGDGPLRDSLWSIVNSLWLKDKVIFTGAQKDIPTYLNAFDLFVLSSVREGTSLTLLEAMATELPVVATDVGGNSKVIVNSETGLLVPAKSLDKLAEAIITLAKNRQLCEKMGKAGRVRVEHEFSLTKMTESYAKLYRSLVHECMSAEVHKL